MVPTEIEIQAARLALAQADPLMAKADAMISSVAWRVRERGFAGLVRQIVGQQVSVAAADAIRVRLIEGHGGKLTPEAVLGVNEEYLRGLGLSGQKARYVRAIAEAAEIVEALDRLDDATAVASLTSIKGVGRWTAETYLMFSEGRRDFFPAGDIALQEGFRILEGGTVRPSEKALYQHAERWRPHRSVAALMLWAVYAVSRQRATEVTGSY